MNFLALNFQKLQFLSFVKNVDPTITAWSSKFLAEKTFIHSLKVKSLNGVDL